MDNAAKDSLFQITQLSPISRVQNPTPEEFHREFVLGNRAVILTGVVDNWPCAQKWSLDYMKEKVKKVKVQTASEFGVYHFLKFKNIPVEEFIDSLTGGGDLYLSADPIMGRRGVVPENCQLGALADDIPIPTVIPKDDIVSCNLWVGPGGNRTLLHYDAWHSYLTVLKGTKKFATYHPRQTHKLHQFGLADLKALREGRTMDSRVNPIHVQDKYKPSTKLAVGLEGELHEGEVLFLPAGTWHYIESHGINVALNFFWDAKEGALWHLSPLREYRIKTKMMLPWIQKASRIKSILTGRGKHNATQSREKSVY